MTFTSQSSQMTCISNFPQMGGMLDFKVMWRRQMWRHLSLCIDCIIYCLPTQAAHPDGLQPRMLDTTCGWQRLQMSLRQFLRDEDSADESSAA